MKPSVSIFQDFDGQHFHGSFELWDAKQATVIREGTVTLTLFADKDLCTATFQVKEADYAKASPHFVKFSAASPKPCGRPASPAKIPMNLRVRFQGNDGLVLEDVQNPQGAGDWAEKLQHGDDESAVVARAATERDRLNAIVDAIPAAGSKPDRMACTTPITGPVRRMLYDHLLVNAHKMPGDKEHEIAWYHFVSDVELQWLSEWSSATTTLSQKAVGEELHPTRFVEIIRVEQFTGPKVLQSKTEKKTERRVRTETITKTIDPAAMTAMLDVVDLDAKKVVCRGRLSARNSPAFANKSIEQDFRENFDAAAADVEKAIAGKTLWAATR